MRRLCLLVVLLFAAAGPASAQLGINVPIKAGTPEDKALSEIDKTTDPAQKLALMDEFFAEFGKGEMAVLAYDLYVNYYLSAKNYDKVFEYGDKLFSVDPDNFANGVNLVRAAQEKGDTGKLFEYGEKTVAIVRRYKDQAPPQGANAADWEMRKAQTLSQIKDNLAYVEQALFAAAYRTPEPPAKAGLLVRFAGSFPESSTSKQALAVAAATYQQAQNYPKMLEVANSLLAKDPNDLGMLILLADYFSEKGEQLEKAEAYAKKALEVLETTRKPEEVADDQWQKQTAIQRGLALTSLGQINITRKRDALALENFKAAAPLLKLDAFTYGRNQYRMGFALLNLNRTAEARAVLTEAASINSPYKALAQQKLNTLPPGPAGRRRKP